MRASEASVLYIYIDEGAISFLKHTATFKEGNDCLSN